MSPKYAQRGFTMIELIVVIVILGVLAAIAVPRMTNLQRDARVAKLNAARGAVQSAGTMVYGSAMARQGQTQPNCQPNVGPGPQPPMVQANGSGNICTDRGRVAVFNLYPAATLDGIIASAGLVQVNGVPTVAQLAAEGYEVQVNNTNVVVRVTGGSNANNCAFTYTRAAAVGRAPAISTPNTTGC